MSWFTLAILAYFLNALVSIIDKILVSKKIPNPVVYSFYVGLLSITVLMFVPFGFFLPAWPILIAALSAGILFFFGLFLLFTALRQDEASRVIPSIGSLTPIFTLCLAFLFLGEELTLQQIIAFIFLMIGSALIGLSKEKLGYKIKGLKLPVLAAFLFSFSFILTKFVFLHQPFFNGFIWTRLGSFLAALFLLIPTASRKSIFKIGRETKEGVSFVFVGGKAMAGLSFLLLNAAIFRGSVTLVNGLQGVQYAFVFLLALLFSLKFPKLLQEKINSAVLIQKILAVCLIVVGLIILWFH